MDAKGKKRIVIWVSVAALLGVGGYFAYKIIKKKRAEKKAEEDAKNVSDSSTPTSSGNSASTPPNPFKSSQDLVKFQNYVIGVANDSAILGKTGADGKWGKNSYAAYLKYFSAYNNWLATNWTNKPSASTTLGGVPSASTAASISSFFARLFT